VTCHRLHLPTSPETALAAIQEAAGLWGADWQPSGLGGSLTLPVVQGLRRGFLQASLKLIAEDEGCSLELSIDHTELTLNRSAVAILVLGGLGGLSLVFWPLSPMILGLAPIGAVLAVVAWLMVVSRLRNSGVDDFLALVSELVEPT
jgi:hypothetical protein